VPPESPSATGFKNRIGHRRFTDQSSKNLVAWLCATYNQSLNQLIADPFQFDQSEKRYAGKGSKLI